MLIQNGDSHFKINPSAGAAIEELYLKGRCVIRTQDEIHFQSSLLFPFPNRLEEGKFNLEGESYQFDLNDFGRPNALHGLIFNMEFQVEQIAENEVEAELTYSGEHESYPFPFHFRVNYKLKKRSLKISHEITNTGSGVLPCGYGWHPYFHVDGYDELRLKAPSKKQVEINEHMIPTGRKGPYYAFDKFESVNGHNLDTCFKLKKFSKRASTFLKLPDYKLEIWQDRNFRFLQVFTPDNQESIAIEPMTCNVNALNNGEGLKILEPNEKWGFNYGVKLHS